jgi:N-methylhydantoinase B
MTVVMKSTQQVNVESPILLEIVKGAIRSSQSEMAALLDRTAMSPFIREKKDYFIGFFDAKGELIHGAGLPLMGDIIKPVLTRFATSEINPGDIFWYNDCYGSQGAVSHTPDQVIIAPVFIDGTIRAFTQSWAHFNDIGGLRPGTLSPDATDIFQEGTIVPPVKLFDAGKANDAALEIFAANSRYPDMVRGDIRALVAAVRLGAKRLTELFDRYGAEIILRSIEQAKAQTSRVVRKRLEELLPPGEYTFCDKVDTDGQKNGPFDIRLDIRVTEDRRISIDTSRSSDQAPGPVNFIMNPAVPKMTLGIYAARNDTSLLINQGLIDAVENVTVREGSILQPRFPAPLGLRGTTFIKVQQAVLGVLNVATKGEAVAASNAYSLYYLRGRNTHGKPFLLTDGIAVGYGARPTKDGIDAVYFIAQENYPIEFIEMGYPIRVREYGMHMDSGGPGRWRGGCGVIREVELIADEAICSVRIEGTINPPWGTAGGQAGRAGRIIVNPGRESERMLPSIADGVVLRKGDVLRMETGGGGGWGHPLDREPERVAEDVRKGMVSLQSALRDYGVHIDPETMTCDPARTDQLRGVRGASGLFHNGQYTDAML